MAGNGDGASWDLTRFGVTRADRSVPCGAVIEWPGFEEAPLEVLSKPAWLTINGDLRVSDRVAMVVHPEHLPAEPSLGTFTGEVVIDVVDPVDPDPQTLLVVVDVIAEASRFTHMRNNIAWALGQSAAIEALGLTVHAWDGERKAVMDDAKTTLAPGIRVDPGSITFDAWAANATTRFDQTIELQCWLPEQKGLKAEQIEAIVWAICLALAPMIRKGLMHYAVPGVETVLVKGGSVALEDMSRDPNRQPRNADMAWSHVCAVAIEHRVALSELGV